jgi:hypothetical protein
VIFAFQRKTLRSDKSAMRIICSWCRREGDIGLIGEKAPLEDFRETHSICKAHQITVQARWREGVYVLEQQRDRRKVSPSPKKQILRKKAV